MQNSSHFDAIHPVTNPRGAVKASTSPIQVESGWL